MIQLKLSESEIEVLQRYERNAYDGNEAIRCRIVLLNARGYTTDEIANIFDRNTETVRRALRRYPCARIGRPRKVTKVGLMCADWQKQKEQKKIPTPGKNKLLSAFGAIVQNQKKKEAKNFGIYFYLTQYWRTILIMTTPHHSKKTDQHLFSKKYKRLHLVFLPTYSPWLDLIEANNSQLPIQKLIRTKKYSKKLFQQIHPTKPNYLKYNKTYHQLNTTLLLRSYLTKNINIDKIYTILL